MAFTIATEIEINCDPGLVWSVLMAFDAWPIWTQALVLESGRFERGQRLRLSMAQGNGGRFTIAPTVTSLVPARRLQWIRRTGLPGIFDSKRDFVLTETETGGTILLSKEVYSGFLSRYLASGAGAVDAQTRFESFSTDLKARAEELRGD